MSLEYRNEKPLFVIVALLSGLFWLGLIAGTLGIALLYFPLFFLGYCFVQSGLIAYIRGTAVELGKEQMPELYQQFLECCDRLGLAKVPRVFILNGQGLMNALATRFLRKHYVILFSDVVDSLEKQPSALDFYMGHEIGHIKRKHLAWAWFVAPGMILPIIGTAYSRAREYSCDLHGLACCDDAKDAAIALGLLAAGERSWEKLNLSRYAKQSDDAKGFWMSFHELTSDYPWLTKRMKHVMSAAAGRPARFPGRNPFAYLFALGVPRVAVGAGGGLTSLMMAVAVVGILAAIAIPNFLRFQQKARIAHVREARDTVEASASEYIKRTGYLPSSLERMGLSPDFSNVAVQSVEGTDTGFLLHLDGKFDVGGQPAVLELTPYLDAGAVKWHCAGNFEEALVKLACGDKPLAAPAAELEGALASAMDSDASSAGGGAAAQPQPQPQLTPNAEVCSREFRKGPVFAQLSKKDQDALRWACNMWKLKQVE